MFGPAISPTSTMTESLTRLYAYLLSIGQLEILKFWEQQNAIFSPAKMPAIIAYLTSTGHYFTPAQVVIC